MSITGYYYLHINGELVYKTNHAYLVSDLRDSDFVKVLWPIDPTDRESAWTILVEALAAGANAARIQELAAKWQCDDSDALVYAGRAGAMVTRDGNAWCATRRDFVNLQESPAGFGSTALEAMAALCKELGYRPAKMWGVTFKSVLARAASK